MFNNTNCQKCNKQLQGLRGCQEALKSAVTLTGTDIQVTRCPVRDITGIENVRIEAYLMFEKGFLPNPGGWLNQPMKFSEMMLLLDALVGKFQKEKEEWQPKTSM